MDRKILVPVDGSAAAERVIAAIIARKAQFQAPLTVLHVVNIDKLAYRMIPDFQLDMIRNGASKSAPNNWVELTLPPPVHPHTHNKFACVANLV